MIPLERRLQQGPYPLWADGATGTEFQIRKLIKPGEPPESLLLTNEPAVIALAREYVTAGAEVILTNTFGATLRRLGLQLDSIKTPEDVTRFNTKAARLAREAAGNNSYVVGSIGPLGELVEPYGTISYEEAVSFFRDQVKGLIAGEVDGIVCETAWDIKLRGNGKQGEVEAAIEAIRQEDPGGRIPFGVTMSFDRQGQNGIPRTNFGTSVDQLVQFGIKHQLHFMGANCGMGYELAGQIMSNMRTAAPNGILWAKFNAGSATVGKNYLPFYKDATPEKAAVYLQNVINYAKVIGMCCGSNPGLIRAMIQCWKQQNSSENI